MSTFIEEIIDDIDWRVSELTSLKAIPIQYSFNPIHRQQHTKFAIPAVYSIWEGFVKTSLSIYINHLSRLNIQRTDISINLLTHYIDTFCNLNNPRTSFESKRKVVENLDKLFIETINITPDIPTESNVNYKVLTSLLNRFCVACVDTKYEKGLNRLLLFRNKIAHGENAIRVEEKDLTEFIKLVEDLMIDIVINIQDAESKKTYKKILS